MVFAPTRARPRRATLPTFRLDVSPVSLWRSDADPAAFAYRLPEHRASIARTALGWPAGGGTRQE
jgi:hypothetical protein